MPLSCPVAPPSQRAASCAKTTAAAVLAHVPQHLRERAHREEQQPAPVVLLEREDHRPIGAQRVAFELFLFPALSIFDYCSGTVRLGKAKLYFWIDFDQTQTL